MRLNAVKRRLRIMIAEDKDEELLIMCYRRVRFARRDLEKSNQRALEIRNASFNLNKYNKRQCFRLIVSPERYR